MKTKITQILTSKATLAVITISALCVSGMTLALNQNKIDLVTPEEEYHQANKEFSLAEKLLKEKRLNLCLATKSLAQAKELAHINGEAVLSQEDLDRVQSKTKWDCF